MGKLYIGTADDLYRFYNLISLFLKTLLAFLGNGQHGSGAEGIAGVYTQRIDVFDEADGDHVVVFVTDYFQLQLFPAQNGFFYQYLAHQTGLQASGADHFQFFFVVYQTAAGAAHGIGGTEYDRISQLVCNGQGFVNTVGNLASGHLDAKFIHGFFEFDTVFSALNGIYLYTNDFYVVFVQNARLVQL